MDGEIHARPETRQPGGGTTLNYYRRESAHDSRCMHACLVQGARLPEEEVSGVDTMKHHILGIRYYYAVKDLVK
jgi:hypothetical protein